MSSQSNCLESKLISDAQLHQPPESLAKKLELVSKSFNGSQMRNMEDIDTSHRKLYALLTSYESHNYLWIHPTRIKTFRTDVKYNKYLKKINKAARKDRLESLKSFKVGTDCLARYHLDENWYRAMIVGEKSEEEDKWPVLFIDYGNSQETAAKDLMQTISDDAYDHHAAPMQAVCCHLYNIKPERPGLRSRIDDKLREFLEAHTSDFVEVQVRRVRADQVIDCDIFLCSKQSSDQDVTDRLYTMHIGQELVDSGLATFVDPLAAHAITDTMSEDFASLNLSRE